MIKHILFTALVTFGLSNLQAQTVILNGDFESGITSDWTVVIADTGVLDNSVSQYAPGWIAVPDPDDSTDTIAGASSFFTTNTQASRWLITPALNLTDYGNFIKWEAKSHDPSYPDTYRVMLSTTDTQLSSFTDTIGYVQYEWYQYIEREVDLTSLGYANQTVYVAFILETTQGYKLYFNNIEARVDDPLGLDEQANVYVNVYPNPTSDWLAVQSESPVKNMTVYSISGQAFAPVKINDNRLDVSGLAAGVYLVRIETTNGIVTKRFEKR